MRKFVLFALMLLMIRTTQAADPPTSPFAQNERVVLAGGVFCERETEHGSIELAHQLAFPERQMVFRNLGWSGDNVYGESRAYFGPVEQGYHHLLEYTGQSKPTLIYCCYGLAESYAGMEKRKAFRTQYEKLLTDLSKITPRIVLVTPTPLVPKDFPAAGEALESHRKVLGQYVQTIRELAQAHQLPLVDLYHQGEAPELSSPMTIDGIHLTAAGYKWVAKQMVSQLGGKTESLQVLEKSDRSKVVQPLVDAIRLKNELYFHRFRPQNETYLRGFRKHEQGQNAVEILEYEPLLKRQDDYLQQTRTAVLAELN